MSLVLGSDSCEVFHHGPEPVWLERGRQGGDVPTGSQYRRIQRAQVMVNNNNPEILGRRAPRYRTPSGSRVLGVCIVATISAVPGILFTVWELATMTDIASDPWRTAVILLLGPVCTALSWLHPRAWIDKLRSAKRLRLDALFFWFHLMCIWVIQELIFVIPAEWIAYKAGWVVPMDDLSVSEEHERTSGAEDA